MNGPLSRVVRPLVLIITALGVVTLSGSVILNFCNIVARYSLHDSIDWAEEVMLFLMVGCVFFGAGVSTWNGSHIRMDVFLRLMPKPLQTALNLFSELLLVITAIALVAFAWPVIRQLHAFDQRSMAADIPLYIPQLVIPIGLSIMEFLVVCRLVSGHWRTSADEARH